MDTLLGRPGDRRNFVHKKIFGGIKGAIGGFLGGGPLGAVGGAFRGITSGRNRGFVPPIPIQTFSPPPRCPEGFFTDTSGQCAPLRTARSGGIRGIVERLLPGGETGFQDFGEASMGRFGAGLEPGVRSIDTRVCPRGTVLAVDGLCYNRTAIKNSDRMWPRGRRPLLTGGDMRAISIASRAARRLQAKQKQLQELGMLKAPTARRRGQKKLPSGHHAHVAHD